MAFDITAALHELLDQHGLKTNRVGEKLSISDKGVGFSGAVLDHSNPKLVQLDIRVQAPALGKRTLIESFAGIGDNRLEAARDAFGKFLRASLHVLLAVLVERKLGADQVEWEIWEYGNIRWLVCLGPLLTNSANSAGLSYGDLLDQIKERLLPNLSVGCHWLRIYYMRNDDHQVGSEALLDNAGWVEGQRIVDTWAWPDGQYSVRNFFMLLPESTS